MGPGKGIVASCDWRACVLNSSRHQAPAKDDVDRESHSAASHARVLGLAGLRSRRHSGSGHLRPGRQSRGRVAGQASWLAFALAMLVAGLTAISYAELASRLPHSGGAAVYCLNAFGRPSAGLLVGWFVLCSGMVSLATVARAFAGYAQAFVPGLPGGVTIVLLILVLGVINFRGMRESSASSTSSAPASSCPDC